MDTNTFYFLCHPRGDKGKITVIDLSYACDYERHDWDNVNDLTFSTHTDAIDYARKLANKYDLTYIPFESRYNESIKEYLYL